MPVTPVALVAEKDHSLIGQAENILVSASTPVISISPVTIYVPGCIVSLQVRVSAPTTGNGLPIILFSHGHDPLCNFWAAHGFVVIQPTHLSSKSLSLDPTTLGAPLFWRSRAEDMRHILDELDLIEASVPGLRGRLDRSRVAIAGHSLGGHTAAMLMGARLTDPKDGSVVDMIEPRFKAGVVIGAPGKGGADLSVFAAEHYPELGLDFSEMKTPGLVLAGDKDSSPYLTVRGADWRADPYFLSTGPKSLLTLLGGEHGLGGISGYDAGETTDENPERVAAVQRLTWAYTRSVLYPGDPAWSTACSTLKGLKDIGRVESK